MEQIIENLKLLYPCSDEGDVDSLSSDLMSVLSLEDWNEQFYKIQCVPALQQLVLFEKVATEPSLIGAANKGMFHFSITHLICVYVALLCSYDPSVLLGMAVSAFKRLLLDLVSCAMVKVCKLFFLALFCCTTFFLANKHCFSLTAFQHKRHYKPNFSKTNRDLIGCLIIF